MSNIVKLPAFFNVSPLLLQIEKNPMLWKEITVRQNSQGTCHGDTETIFIRMCERIDVDSVFNDLEAVDYPAYSVLPQVRPIVSGVMAHLEGERLGRVMLVKLKDGGRVLPHPDEGAYAEYYDRFHVPLFSGPGNTFRVGDEAAYLEPGRLWWFDKSQVHEAVNDSGQDRIHLIMDIRLAQ
jgi:hypothetical protein